MKDFFSYTFNLLIRVAKKLPEPAAQEQTDLCRRRHGHLKAGLARVMIPLAALLLAVPATSQDASMFRGNLAHTGIYPGAGVQKLQGIKWKFKTGGARDFVPCRGQRDGVCRQHRQESLRRGLGYRR